MKAIILARVSTHEQEEGHSIPSQVRRLEDYAKSKKLDVKQCFQIVESSTKDTRAEFEKVVTLIKNSKEPLALVVDTIDRLQRSFKESVILDDLRRSGKVEIHFYRENLVLSKEANSSELLRWDMGVMLSRSYVLQLGDNVKRSIEHKLRTGTWIGKAPIGYINVTDEATQAKNIVLDPEKSHVIKKMFEMYASGKYSIKLLGQEMKKLGLKSDKGTYLSDSNIYATLRNPFYYGMMKAKGREYEHKYEPLIPPDLFRRVQSVMQGWKKKPFQYAAKPFIFRGLITCEKCGCTVTPEMKKGKYIYYSCTNGKGGCTRIWVPEQELLNPVYNALDSLKMTQERIDEVVQGIWAMVQAKTLYQEQEIRKVRTEYDQTQVRIDNVLNYLLDGSITKDTYEKKLKELKEKQIDCEIRMEAFTKADESFYLSAAQVFSLSARAREIFEISEPNEKRQLLNFLLQNCRLSGKNLVFELRNPFDTIALCASQSVGLPLPHTFGTVDWTKILRNFQEVVPL